MADKPPPTFEEAAADRAAFLAEHPEAAARLSAFTDSSWHRMMIGGIDPRGFLGIPGHESDYSRQARLDDAAAAKFLEGKQDKRLREEYARTVEENRLMRQQLNMAPREYWQPDGRRRYR